MRPLAWMWMLRDLSPKLPTARLAVLWSLALRMGPDGSGFASTRRLADDAAVTERTVLRATGWAREAGHLVQVQRGHRLGNGQTRATRWQLADAADNESQPDTSDTLREAEGESQPDTRPSQHDTRTAEETHVQEGAGYADPPLASVTLITSATGSGVAS